ncbi:MAG: aminotransferase class I/II-fold pyridoxal phosphate-dependent enzyme [Clostridium sp.]|nr:aminotransferase class I/II-fold pyridoxal phosphate-dependent enzyme [Clostridium sp.]
MQAVILAAGMGKRLQKLTKNNTKCMVEVNGVTLIERALRILDKKCLSRIIIVVGYESKKLMDYIESLHINTPVRYIDNKIYHKTNNIYSLALAKDCLTAEDTLILESDLIFEEAVIDILLQDKRETLALADKFESWMDGTCMVLDDDDCICDFIPGKYLKFSEKEKYYKTVNIYKFSQHFSKNTYVPFLEAYETAMGNNEYYESVIKLIALLDTKEIRAKRLDGQIWYEIDDIQDLDVACSLFTEDDADKYRAITKRYGGYWRYPKLLDFCYLVNPYYPPEKMTEEIKSNFETLLTQYPSGMRVNSLLAAKNFNIDQDYIVIGNGAAELIQVLMRNIQGKAGFIRPTFEEYPNRYQEENSVYMNVDSEYFSYSADDIITFFGENPVDVLVIVNPDNPSGNYINMAGLKRLIEWCKQNNIKLIIDESFVDFVDSDDSLEQLTLIAEDILETYEGLFVIKSISKSYGIPGIRLGVMASADKEAIKQIKVEIPIWNINSFGEFYMQIAEKYRKAYIAAITKIKETRNDFLGKLEKMEMLHVIPSQANYIMCEIVDGTNSNDLACYLLQRNILIKDLAEKIKNGRQYIRLAVRRREENDYLIQCLQEYEKRG